MGVTDFFLRYADDAAVTADAPLDPRLLQSVPARPALDFENLEQEVARQRRIVVLGEAGIPLSAVLAVGGALVIHGLLIGGFLVSFYLLPAARFGGSGGVRNGDAERGGSEVGYLFLGDGPEVTAAPKPAIVEAVSEPQATPQALPAPGKLVIAPRAKPTQLAMNDISPPGVDSPVIGIPSGVDLLGSVRVMTPQPHVEAPALAVGLPIAPPSQMEILASPIQGRASNNMVAGAGGKSHAPSLPGGDDGGGDEVTIDLMAPGHGDGASSGNKHGSGIDRGASGANNETPAVLDPPEFKLWADYENHPPKKRVILNVTVLANGKAGTIEIVQSCGIDEIDQAYKDWVAQHYRFRPAYRDLKPFAASIECSQSFGEDQ